MAKILIAALVVLAAAALAFGAGDIVFTECIGSSECKTGCKAMHKIPTGQCHTAPFRHSDSMLVNCAPAPTGLCYYVGVFQLNASSPANSCVDSNVKVIDYHRCDVCLQVDGRWQIATGCNSSSTMTINMGCDANTCANCKHTHKVVEKQCLSDPTKFPDRAFMFTSPTKCNTQISYAHFNNTDCADKPQFTEWQFADTCYSFGRNRSHYYHCA
jgi:hypothetical protein